MLFRSRDLSAYLTWLRERGADLGDVQEEDVLAYVHHLVSLGRAPSTVARATVAVRSLHRFLAGEGFSEADPTAAVDVPRVPRGLPKALTEDEVGRLLASPVGDDPLTLRDRAMLESLYGMGLRISELVGTSLGDLDLSARLLREIGRAHV